jgi:CrcB protein
MDALAPKLGLVFLGAGTGGVLRYGVSLGVSRLLGPSGPGSTAPLGGLPVGTIVVNVTGCFAIGVLGTLLAGPGDQKETWRLALMVGVLGGYTTFSAFGRETLVLAQEGKWGAALGNVVLSNVLGIGAVVVGWWVASRLGPQSAV